MRAVIRRAGVLVVDDMATPIPQAGQILCKTLACGICGSDLHALDH
jgi:threonine dehydrogenase-like Zn-dependent dehydrogenase